MESRAKRNGVAVRCQEARQAVLSGIERGEWRAHERLPSVRAMAERLGMHRLTAFKAYEQLREERVLYVRSRSGYYVSPATTPAAVASSREAAEQPWVYGAESFYTSRSRLAEIHGIPVTYQLSQALIEPALLPNLFLSEYVKEVFDLYPKVLGTYSSVQGDPEFREAMAGYFTDSCGMEVTGDEILVTTGSQQAIDLVSRALLRPGDAVLIERPTYSAAIDILRHQGIRMLPVNLTEAGYDLEQVERLMREERPRLFYMNPTFQNPTGFTVPRQQRKQLVELAERYRCILIEDDAIHDIYFDTPPPPPLFSYDTEGYVIYIRSFSKYIAPGLRSSVLAARPSLMRSLVPVKSLLDNGTPLLNQKVFLHYFFSSRLQEHVAKLRIALHLRKERMECTLAGTGWSWSSPQGGLNLWVRLPDGLSAERLLEHSLQHSISFIPGSICDPLGEMDSWVRLSYAYVNESLLEEGMKRLISVSGSLAEP